MNSKAQGSPETQVLPMSDALPRRRVDDTAGGMRPDIQGQDLVARMAHELRTPLSVAREYVDLVRDGFVGELNPDQHGYLEIAEQNLDYLTGVIDDMLDLARIDSGAGVRLDLQHGRVAGILEQVVSLLGRKCEAVDIALTRDDGNDMPPVLVEPRRVKRVLMNLLGNAIKFTPPGGRIHLEVLSQPEAERVWVAVCDTGCGIDPEDHELIFDAFRQLPGPDGEEGKGSGLGLTIAREIVHLHGGEIGVESRPRSGSRFWFTLPTLTPTTIEESVIVPALERVPRRRGALSVVAVQLTRECSAALGPDWPLWAREQLRTADRVLLLDDDLAVIVAPSCLRATRAIVRRVTDVLRTHGAEDGQFWMDSVTYPSPGISQAQFMGRARRLLERGRSGRNEP